MPEIFKKRLDTVDVKNSYAANMSLKCNLFFAGGDNFSIGRSF